MRRIPDPVEKLALIGDANRFEAAGDRPDQEQVRPALPRGSALADLSGCITQVTTPTGKKLVLKAMATTACEQNCYYCPFRAGRSEMRRLSFTPDELALAFDRLQRAGLVDGIFLSSGIVRGGITSQDAILDTAEIIRQRYGYRGYVHLKIMPGAEREQLFRAMQLADRVSINLEGPTEERLNALAPMKTFGADLLQRLRWAHAIRQQAWQEMPGAIRASVVTQFVVGAVGDTDVELLSLSAYLHRQLRLTRAYYSAFQPIPGTPFEDRAPTHPLREHRLYQASFLIRDYGWDVEELPFEQTGNLRLDVDPKRAWADEHLREAPVELMTASRAELLRVPGIGPVAADAIIRARRTGHLKEPAHLRALGIRGVERLLPYVLLDGRRPTGQLPLF